MKIKSKHLIHFLVVVLITLIASTLEAQEKPLFKVIEFKDDMSFDWDKALLQPIPKPLEEYAIRKGKELFDWIKENEPENLPEGASEEYYQGLYEYRNIDSRYRLWIILDGPLYELYGGYFCVEDIVIGKFSLPYLFQLRWLIQGERIIDYRDFDDDGNMELIIKQRHHAGTEATWEYEHYYNITPGPCLKKVFKIETFSFWGDDSFPFKSYDIDDVCVRNASYDARKKEVVVKCKFERNSLGDNGKRHLVKAFAIRYKKNPANGKYYPTKSKFKKKYSALILTDWDLIKSRADYEDNILDMNGDHYEGISIADVPVLGKDVECK